MNVNNCLSVFYEDLIKFRKSKNPFYRCSFMAQKSLFTQKKSTFATMKKVWLMNLLVSVACTLFLASGCSQDKGIDEFLQRADSVMISRPDSALGILRVVGERGSKAQRMRHALLLTDAMNKCDVPFASDSVMRRVADYYNRRGTANEQVRANYLLGRVYHEMGDGPQALECYLKAEACADTTRADCDYYLLECVHQQAYLLFRNQRLLQQMEEEIDKIEQCAWKAGDTVNVVYSYFLRTDRGYIADRSTEQQLETVMKSYYLARKYFPEETDSFLGAAIPVYLEREEWDKAKELMDRYEATSMWDSESQTVRKGGEIYYYNKGLYYLGTGRPDSADYFFRKEWSTAKDGNNRLAAAKGLLRLYKHLNKTDSVARYAQLAYHLNDSLFQQNNADYLQQMEATYNYSQRVQQNLQEQKHRQRAENLLAGTLFIVAAVMTAIVIVARRQVSQRHRRQQQYRNLLLQHEQKEKELWMARNKMEIFIRDKEEEVSKLKKQIEVFGRQKGLQSAKGPEEVEIITTQDAVASEKDWDELFRWTEQNDYLFYKSVMNPVKGLNFKEKAVAILIRMGVENNRIISLLGIKDTYLSYLKKQLNEKLAGKTSARGLEEFIRKNM